MSFTTAVIGSGAAGISATLAMRSVGSMVTCFEATETIGGVWNYNGNDGTGGHTFAPGTYTGATTPLHPSMRCVLPKDMMAFSDMRFPFMTPQFPHYGAVQQYLRDYAVARGMQSLTRFNTLVERVEWNAERRQWAVRTVNVRNGDVMSWWFDSVVVATGRFHRVRLPLVLHNYHQAVAPLRPRTMRPVRGQLAFENAGGLVLHSSDVKRFREFRGQNVVVVGRGVGAAECVRELRRHGAFAIHSPGVEDGEEMETGAAADDAAEAARSAHDGGMAHVPGANPLQRIRQALVMRILLGGRDSRYKPPVAEASKGSTLVARMLHSRNTRFGRLPLPPPSPKAVRDALARRSQLPPAGSTPSPADVEDVNVYGSSPGFVKMPSLGRLVCLGEAGGSVGGEAVGEPLAVPVTVRPGEQPLDARSVVIRFPTEASMFERVLGQQSRRITTTDAQANPARAAGGILLKFFQEQGLVPAEAADKRDLLGWSPLRRHAIRAAAREAAVDEALGLVDVPKAVGHNESAGGVAAATEPAVVVRNVAAVIFCTGYYQAFPFLDESVRLDVEKGSRYGPSMIPTEGPPAPAGAETGEAAKPSTAQQANSQTSACDSTSKRVDTRPTPLFQSMYLGSIYHHNPTLAFVGLPANMTPPFTLMEAQARYVAYVLARRIPLPKSAEAMTARERDTFGLAPHALASTSGCGVVTSALLYDALLREIAGERPMAADEKAATIDGVKPPPSTSTHEPGSFEAMQEEEEIRKGGAALQRAKEDAARANLELHRLKLLRSSYYWDHMGWQRFWWYVGTSAVSSMNKFRSYAPLKRKEQHVIISNQI